MTNQSTRRDFIAASSLGGLACLVSSGVPHAKPLGTSANKISKLGFGGIGLRYQGSVDLHTASHYGDVVAVCDVDKNVRDQAKAAFGSRPASYEDYHDLINNKKVDVVVIATPDHWHVKIAADALRAGKHVYVEKPLTLTVDEGKFLTKIAAASGKILQVGSWQRSDSRFRLAVEMVRGGRIGKLQKVDVVLGKNVVGGPFETRKTPSHINWDLWQGQTPNVPYLEERSHYTFRWWYEYSGGQMTDWGAHHIDIAQWAIDSLPVEIESNIRLPSMESPEQSNSSYNVAVDFDARIKFLNGVTMSVSDTGRNGIMFTGDQGRIFVNRGTISGAPVDALKSKPLQRTDFKLYDTDNLERPERKGKLDAILNHMGNLVDCIESNKQPISDVVSQHQSATTCHITNISMRLDRPLKWDPTQELFVDDAEANQWLRREQRSGFEVI